jgi:hypothetical protein
LQFDLLLPSSLSFVSAVTGTAAATAQKTAYANPTGSGVNFVLFGMNSTAIGPGPVVVATLRISPGTPVSTIPVVVGNLVASDPVAAPVMVSMINGSISVLPPPDTVPPVISNLSVSGISSSGAVIGWTTNEASDSQVQFGTTTAYGSTTAPDPTLMTTHSQTVSGLAANTTYHFSVKSADASKNFASSADATFTTASGNTAPMISRVTVSRTSTSGASISWNTDIPADTQLFYGTTSNCGLSTRLNTSLVTAHAQSLNGLRANTLYYYRVQSRSAAGLLAQSSVLTFTTAAKKTKSASSRSAREGVRGSEVDGGPEPQGEEYKGVVVTNLGATPAELTFVAHRAAGVEFSAADKAQRTLLPGRQLVLMDTDLFGDWVREPGALEWIEIQSSSQDVAGFAMVFDAGLWKLDHTELLPQALTDFLFAEIGDGGATSLHISNPNAVAAKMTFQLFQSDGLPRASVQRSLDAGSVMVESVSSLFPETEVAASDYLRVNSDPGVVPVERFGTGSRDTASLSGVDVNRGAEVLYCLDYAAVGARHSSLSVTNLEPREGMLELRLYRDDGAQIGRAQEVPIAANGKVTIADPFFVGAAEGGSAAGYFRISGEGLRIAGHAVFGDAESGTALAALPLADRAADALVISHLASNSVSFTQLALLNPNDAEVSAAVNLYLADGTMEASTLVTVAAGQRITRSLTQLFAQLEGQDRTSGYLEVLADRGVIGYSLLGSTNSRALDAVQAQPVRGKVR